MKNEQFSQMMLKGRQAGTAIPEAWPDLMNRQQASEFLGVKVQTLACWATNKRYALPYVKIGRLVKYKRQDLEVFIQQNRISEGVYNG